MRALKGIAVWLGFAVVAVLAYSLIGKVGGIPDVLAVGALPGSGVVLLAGTFGSKFTPMPNSVVQQRSTPQSGMSAEVIWHQLYDTQTYTDNATTRSVFFQVANADKTLSNMEASGQLPSPQMFQIHNVALDILSTIPVTTAAGGIAGVLNDLALLIFGAAQRPTWTLHISQKAYGPYSLTTLHGTGGPTGFGWGTFTAEESIQFAKNDPVGGWNYFGQLTIRQQESFDVELNWAAAADTTEDKRFRVSLFGVLNRRVL